jgi:phosphoribosylformylglycinamidine synthase
MGYREILNIRQGKYFEIGLAEGIAQEKAAQMLEEVARDILSNPVIEDYRLEIVG